MLLIGLKTVAPREAEGLGGTCVEFAFLGFLRIPFFPLVLIPYVRSVRDRRGESW